MSVRALVKSAVEQVLGHPMLALPRVGPGKGAAIVLAYHDVMPGADGETGDRSLHLGFDNFRRQLDLLSSRVQLQSLDEILTNSFEGPAAAITFDDAYESACTIALPELEQRKVAATVFVAPAMIGAGVPWWDHLADSEGGMTESVRQYCLEELGGRGEAIRDWSADTSLRRGDQVHCRIAGESTLEALRSHPLVTVGAHTWSHPNLCRVNDVQMREELERPIQWLAQAFPRQHRPWLAYPYGLFNTEVDARAKQAGYERTFAIRGGWFRRDAAPSVLPRLTIPAGMSPGGLSVRLNGFFSRPRQP